MGTTPALQPTQLGVQSPTATSWSLMEVRLRGQLLLVGSLVQCYQLVLLEVAGDESRKCVVHMLWLLKVLYFMH